MRPPASVLVAALLAASAAAPALGDGDEPLTLDVLYHPERKVALGGRPPRRLAWIDDARFHWPRPLGKGEPDEPHEHVAVDARTGETRPLFDADRLAAALVAEAGVSAEKARALARKPGYTFDRARTWLLVSAGGDLFRYEIASGRLVRLTRGPGEEDVPTVSPDERRVAFVRGHDLHVVDVHGRAERRLTMDGSADVLNGKLDWVYQEEVYGRGIFTAHWWSPDSRRLAFLRLDEKGVPRHTLVDETAHAPGVEVQPYPRPGETNPRARLGIVPADGGRVTWADLAAYDKDEPLLVDVAWAKDGGMVAVQVQDRAQTWLDLLLVDPRDGRARRVLRETTNAWTEPHGSPYWLPDGSFLWLSERTGFAHLYRVTADGRATPLTRGGWEVRALLGADPRRGVAYVSATERSATGLDVYQVALDGTGLRRLSDRPGWHEALFNPSFSLYLDTWSDLRTPPQVRVHDADGLEVRVLDGNPDPPLRRYRLATVERLQVPARDGTPLEAILVKPRDFDPSRRYPVLQRIYGGPRAPRVKDMWCESCLFDHLLAGKGVVVWICDPRTASGRGAASAWPAWKQLGVRELEDVEDGVAWLRRQGWVDAARIGIEGWSYGGFMASYALTHSRSFRMGVAGAPVTDWRLYDSIYTERYMGLPSGNADGYRRTSVVEAAADLHGDLFLLHGSIDDNVHPQNTTQLAYRLQKAGKPFRLMMYPTQRHSVSDPYQLFHLRHAVLDFVEETLLDRR